MPSCAGPWPRRLGKPEALANRCVAGSRPGANRPSWLKKAARVKPERVSARPMAAKGEVWERQTRCPLMPNVRAKLPAEAGTVSPA